MDQQHGRTSSIQEAFNNLTLQPKTKTRENITDNILVSKILATSFFQRFTISEIAPKTWRLQAKVHIDKIAENVFKFIFENKKDQEFVFRSRPWSLNGCLVILKEWSADRVITYISFDLATFNVQIHRLPPMFLHEESCE